MSEASEILQGARRRERARDAVRVAPDYAALNKMVRRQKGALTRAVNSGDPERVVVVCRDAVREWDAPGAMWPDEWSRWQRALDDALGRPVDLRDLT
jgi:hypothetical protein